MTEESWDPSTENQVLDNGDFRYRRRWNSYENGSDGWGSKLNRISSGKRTELFSGQRGLSDHSESGERLYADGIYVENIGNAVM